MFEFFFSVKKKEVITFFHVWYFILENLLENYLNEFFYTYLNYFNYSKKIK